MGSLYGIDIPDITDDYNHFLFLPMTSSLYGFRGGVDRWLRVIDKHDDEEETHFYTTTTLNRSALSVVETIDLKSFLVYLSYGYTPFLETAFSEYSHGIDIYDFEKRLITQSALRHYEKRVQYLVQLCEKKQNSFVTRFGTSSQELMAELQSCVYLWEKLMDTGRIEAVKCINKFIAKYDVGINLRAVDKKIDELKARMYYNNFVRMPIKTSKEDRKLLLNSFSLQEG